MSNIFMLWDEEDTDEANCIDVSDTLEEAEETAKMFPICWLYKYNAHGWDSDDRYVDHEEFIGFYKEGVRQ